MVERKQLAKAEFLKVLDPIKLLIRYFFVWSLFPSLGIKGLSERGCLCLFAGDKNTIVHFGFYLPSPMCSIVVGFKGFALFRSAFLQGEKNKRLQREP